MRRKNNNSLIAVFVVYTHSGADCCITMAAAFQRLQVSFPPVLLPDECLQSADVNNGNGPADLSNGRSDYDFANKRECFHVYKSANNEF